MPEPQEVLTPTEARQGSPKRLNFRVLTTSLLLAVIVGAVLYAIFYGGQSTISSPEPATTTEETTPAPAPEAVTPAPTPTEPAPTETAPAAPQETAPAPEAPPNP